MGDGCRKFKAEAEIIRGLIPPALDNLCPGRAYSVVLPSTQLKCRAYSSRLVMPRRTHFGCDHWGRPTYIITRLKSHPCCARDRCAGKYGSCCPVLFRRSRAACVFGNHRVKAQLPCVTGGGFHANVGGDPAQDNGVDTAAAQLQLRVGAIEGAPLAFGHFDIAVAFTERDRIRPPVVRQGVRGRPSTGCFNASAKSADQPTRTMTAGAGAAFFRQTAARLTTSSAVRAAAKGRILPVDQSPPWRFCGHQVSAW